MLVGLGILGIIELIYGILIFYSIITPYSIKASLSDNEQQSWNKHFGLSRMGWGIAFIFFVLWGLKIGSNFVNIIVTILGLIIAIIAPLRIKN